MLLFARTYKCGRVVLSRKLVYFGIDKLTLSFYAEVFSTLFFHVTCIMLNTCFSHCSVLSMFPFLFNQSQFKSGAVYGYSFVAKLSWKQNIFSKKQVFYKIYIICRKNVFIWKKCFILKKFLLKKTFFTEKI